MQQIDRHIKARTPVLALSSPEEARVIEELTALAIVHKKRLMVWSVAIGFEEVNLTRKQYPDGTSEPPRKPAEKANDPAAALLRVITEAEKKDALPTLWVFCDLHQLAAKNPLIARAVRDVAQRIKAVKGVTVILLGANVTIGEDLKKDVVSIEFPLPTVEELREQYESLVASLPDGFKVNLSETELTGLVNALKGLTLAEADSVLSQAAIAHRCLDSRAVSFVIEAKAQIIKESGALEFYPAKASYAEIGGLDLLKEWALQAEKAASPEAVQFGVEAPRSLLLVGVPGCGKSLLAKAVAGPNRPLLRLDIGALFGGLVGQSEQQARAALKIAESVAPCVLWVDEIDKALGSSGGEHDGGTSQRVLGTILTAMQEGLKDVFVVATANNVTGLRPELIRRFVAKFFVDLPQTQERADILSIHLEKRGRKAADFAVETIAQAADGFTGSEIEEVVQEALMLAFGRGAADVTDADLLNVIAQTVPLETTMRESIAAMREWATRARPASSKQETGHHTPTTGLGGLLEF